ncbi:MAG: pentapeptide repeat-containing protein [Elainellaceae cyanobacterium]
MDHVSGSDPKQPIQPQPALGGAAAEDAGVERSPEPSSSLDNLTATGLEKLRQEFVRLRAIGDPLERDYCLIQLAKASEIDTDEYRQMFEAYQQRSAQGVEAVKHFAVRTVRLLGEFTIVLGLLVYIFQADTREQETYTQAWQIITGAEGRTDNAGRIQALQTLNQGCSYWDIQAEEERPTAAWLDPRTWRYADFRRMPVVGGFMPNCISLRGLDVQNAHLPKVELPFAELRYARLQNTGLWSADLQGAQLQGAQLQQSKLRDARLQGVSFTDATLEAADLTNAQLGCLAEVVDSAPLCTDLSQTILNRAILSSSDLSGANLTRASLRGAKLVDANLSRANLSRADLTETNLINADLTGTDLSRADLANSNLQSADLACIAADETQASNGEDSLADSGCANLLKATLATADLTQANLAGANLVGANLSGSKLAEADLTDADLSGANFQGVAGLTIDQVQAAQNWELAVYDADLSAQLGLATDPVP